MKLSGTFPDESLSPKYPSNRFFSRASHDASLIFTEMAQIKPFRALRPRPELASQICELPYDVMSSDEARALASHRPDSFLHVSKPEIDLPPATNPYAREVYEKGKENFARLIRTGMLQQDSNERFYLYRQVMGDHQQTGLVAVAGCQDYLNNIVKKHELTRVDKEDDRVRHIEILNAQTGPAFLTYRATKQTDWWQSLAEGAAPDIDFVAGDGVRHTSWSVTDPATIQRIGETFAALPALYIADGHHRTAAAARVFQTRKGQGNAGCFLSVIFPHHQMQILPYHRVVKAPSGTNPAALLDHRAGVFRAVAGPGHQPDSRRQVAFYSRNGWRLFQFEPGVGANLAPADQLDVALLQRFILEPLFGITDPRTSEAIQFVGGIRGPAELERLVNSATYDCAFAMFPTSIEELMAIADAGGIMPPKSTWFEPKLRDAMFCHLLG